MLRRRTKLCQVNKLWFPGKETVDTKVQRWKSLCNVDGAPGMSLARWRKLRGVVHQEGRKKNSKDLPS